MIVDRRKDSYDELMMLSRDSSLERKRKSQWTTGIVAAAVVASGIYVGGTNEHLGDLAQAKDAAESQRDSLETEYYKLLDERNALRNEREFYKKSNEWLKDLALSAGLGSEVNEVVNHFAEPAGRGGTEFPPQITSANLVWIVDGSRRFPMAAADILWVPEGQFWVKMNAPAAAGRKPNKISIHLGSTPQSPADFEVEYLRQAGEAQYSGYFETSVVPSAGRGASNCVRLTLHEVSNRSGFVNDKYVDMEVLYREATQRDPCNSDLVEIVSN